MAIAGTWDCVVDLPMGKQQSTVALVVNGAELSGEVAGAKSVDKVAEGGTVGNSARFTTKMIVPVPVTLVREFTVDGDALSGSVEAGPLGKSALTGIRK